MFINNNIKKLFEILHSIQKRSLTRSIDNIFYLKFFSEREIPVAKKIQESQYGRNLYLCPGLVERILRVMTAARLKGECPYLSAFPASSIVLMHLYAASTKKNTHPFFKYIRSPKSLEMRRTLKEARLSIPSMRIYQPKPGLLSLSYALISGLQPFETAACWGFTNHLGEEQFPLMIHLLRSCLLENGLNGDSPAFHSLLGTYSQLIMQYSKLPVGNFFIFTLPWEKVDRYIYDSKPFNVPTLEKASEIARTPSLFSTSLMIEGTHMATMMLCHELFEENSPLSIIHANDIDEVNAYCKDFSYTPLKEVAHFSKLIHPEPTSFEMKLDDEQKVLKETLIRSIQEQCHY